MTHDHVLDLVLWVCFLFGMFVYWMKRAGQAARNKKTVGGRKEWFALYWDILLYRATAGSAFFWAWVENGLASLLSLIPGADAYLPTLPRAPYIAIPFGLVVDVFLDWFYLVLGRKFPGLQRQLPEIPPDQSQTDLPAVGTGNGGQKP